MKRVLIIGCPGAGKSTFARALRYRTGLPLFYLDRIWHRPDGTSLSHADFDARLSEILCRDCWIIDGNYSGLCLEERLEQADHIAFLNFPRLRCLWRAWRRSPRYRGRPRADMAEGCPEKLDLEFVLWILRDGRAPARRSRFRALLRCYPDKVVVCKNNRDVSRFISSVTQ